jgi:hypothetical protein
MIIIVFPVNVVNTKVVVNFLILHVLKIHVHRPNGLGVIDVISLLPDSVHALNRYECLVYFTCMLMKSCLGLNRRSVVLLLSFPNC